MKKVSMDNVSDAEILELTKQLRVAYALKRTLRFSMPRDLSVHSESVAEHVFALFFLAQYFLPLEDSARMLDRERIYQMILYHDFGEITHGDVPYHRKTAEHEAREKDAAQGVFASLPASIANTGLERWKEYETRTSKEAKFVYALDKLEPMFELFDPISEKTMKRTKFTFTDHIVRKRRATEDFPVMRRFVEVVSEEMRKRDIFWPES